jgi:hypothetical protein
MRASGRTTASMEKVMRFGQMVRLIKGSMKMGRNMARACSSGRMAPPIRATSQIMTSAGRDYTSGRIRSSFSGHGPTTK